MYVVGADSRRAEIVWWLLKSCTRVDPDRGRRLCRSGRPVRLRQIDPAADARGARNITSGTISIGDRVVNNVQPKERDIAMVFQNYALYPHMTVADNMGFSLKLRAQAPTKSTRASIAPLKSSR